MADPDFQIPHRAAISRMIITIDDGLIDPAKGDIEHFFHVLFDRFGVRTAELRLEPAAPTFLRVGHPALPAQLAVGEVEEEISGLVDCHVVVEREVLTVFEGLEAIDDDLACGRSISHHLLVKQHTVSGETGQVSIDGAWTDLQVPGDLSIGHAADGLHQDGCVDVRSFLPVSGAECLGAEGSLAGLAGKPLDTCWCL